MTEPPMHAQTFTRKTWAAMTDEHREEIAAARRLIVARAKQEHHQRYHEPARLQIRSTAA